ncbi:MAG: DNA/RNA non-specific endonuclease [Muribaculaceae bacterium]|nr:DNA/RNA non-specific endonuclease [Roseburia sp.]MCM1430293.1 DNA/RNA non-specific endonuclease [Muribaculaceae bacterium]MCM1492598.1 DNA/RNA non-specific endonuclease [Muribaculaceae bacterium]
MKKYCVILIAALVLALYACGMEAVPAGTETAAAPARSGQNEGVPVYQGLPYVELNNNYPDFSGEDKRATEAFEVYSELDALGRCGQAYANICPEIQPDGERGSIGNVRPSGWHTVKYSGRIEGNYLYNRCHLIAYQLAGENANERNLITGTRFLNVNGMLPFENRIAAYVEETGNHVLYRVTPVFEGENLLVSGVELEGWSVEDEGEGICFHVYCFNIQPGIGIDYATGESWEEEEVEPGTEDAGLFVINTGTRRFHLPSCQSVRDMAEKNKLPYAGSAGELVAQGYSPCKRCLGDGQ